MVRAVEHLDQPLQGVGRRGPGHVVAQAHGQRLGAVQAGGGVLALPGLPLGPEQPGLGGGLLEGPARALLEQGLDLLLGDRQGGPGIDAPGPLGPGLEAEDVPVVVPDQEGGVAGAAQRLGQVPAPGRRPGPAPAPPGASG